MKELDTSNREKLKYAFKRTLQGAAGIFSAGLLFAAASSTFQIRDLAKLETIPLGISGDHSDDSFNKSNRSDLKLVCTKKPGTPPTPIIFECNVSK